MVAEFFFSVIFPLAGCLGFVLHMRTLRFRWRFGQSLYAEFGVPLIESLLFWYFSPTSSCCAPNICSLSLSLFKPVELRASIPGLATFPGTDYNRSGAKSLKKRNLPLPFSTCERRLSFHSCLILATLHRFQVVFYILSRVSSCFIFVGR